ncbi:hypothetical protein ACW9HL_00020, partial [Nocardia gipuzkoensis]
MTGSVDLGIGGQRFIWAVSVEACSSGPGEPPQKPPKNQKKEKQKKKTQGGNTSMCALRGG